MCKKPQLGMSLRELVTGSDVCSPGDGAGPSNAMAGLANTLVGQYGKEQERLHEVGTLLLQKDLVPCSSPLSELCHNHISELVPCCTERSAVAAAGRGPRRAGLIGDAVPTGQAAGRCPGGSRRCFGSWRDFTCYAPD